MIALRTGLVLASLVLVQASAASAQTTFVPFGATWRYLDDGSDPGPGWSAVGFDDAAWGSGPAPLGYGQGGEATVIDGGPPTNRYATIWFRHAFVVADPSGVGPLTLSLVRDDGAVVYLNGVEVARSNLPAGPIDFQTLASEETSGEDEAHVFRFCPDPSLLAVGDNVLAVELHQADPAGPDLQLDASLVDEPPQLERPPYLQGASQERVVVRWRTTTCSDTRLRWGAAPEDLDQSYDDLDVAIEHEVELTGLTPTTRTYYEVGTTTTPLAGGDADHHIDTPPAPGVRRPIRIWAMGDSGGCGTNTFGCLNAQGVRDAFLAFGAPADVMVLVGDNAYPRGSDLDYTTAVFQTYPTILRNTLLWPAPGNHDFGNADSPTQTGAYYDAFTLPTAGEAGGIASGTEAYYSFDHGNIHFVSLDSHDTDRSGATSGVCAPGEGGLMYQWLCADLAATDQDFVIAFWHHPPYSKGSHDSDIGTDPCNGRECQMRERFVSVLEHFGADLQITGHSHSYERSFLVDGHYGHSSTYDALLHALDEGDGDPDGDGAYAKTALGPVPHDGAVYVVAGTGSRTSGGSFDHPVMRVEMDQLGSLVVDVTGRTLEAWFVDDVADVRDHFVIEKGPELPACDDGIDNDGDGLIDTAEDPGCLAASWPEDPACDDGIDNDGDGGTDWDGAGVGSPDSDCVNLPWRTSEAPIRRSACGLGFELAPILLLLWRLRGRRRLTRRGHPRQDVAGWGTGGRE